MANTQIKKAKITSERVKPTKGRPEVDAAGRDLFLKQVTSGLLEGHLTQGQALKELRLRVLNLKQEQYASMVGVSRKVLSQIENDKGNFSFSIINKVFRPVGLQVGIIPRHQDVLRDALLTPSNKYEPKV